MLIVDKTHFRPRVVMRVSELIGKGKRPGEIAEIIGYPKSATHKLYNRILELEQTRRAA